MQKKSSCLSKIPSSSLPLDGFGAALHPAFRRLVLGLRNEVAEREGKVKSEAASNGPVLSLFIFLFTGFFYALMAALISSLNLATLTLYRPQHVHRHQHQQKRREEKKKSF
jgi:hypothetical protein